MHRQHTRGPHRAEPRSSREDGPIRLFGSHAVEAALANPARTVTAIFATENAERRLAQAIAARGVAVQRVTPRQLDRLLGPDTVHQGIMLEVEPLPDPSLEDLVARARCGAPLLVLDHVTDPHNVGAVLRSAAAFDAAGLVMTRRHSPPLNGTLAKAASGALEIVPVLLVQNLAATFAELKAAGLSVVGLDSEAAARLEAESFAGPVALVIGAEGKGLRQLTRQSCDRLCRIATIGPIGSLNVSNAAAIALHLAAVRRDGAGGAQGEKGT